MLIKYCEQGFYIESRICIESEIYEPTRPDAASSKASWFFSGIFPSFFVYIPRCKKARVVRNSSFLYRDMYLLYSTIFLICMVGSWVIFLCRASLYREPTNLVQTGWSQEDSSQSPLPVEQTEASKSGQRIQNRIQLVIDAYT